MKNKFIAKKIFAIILIATVLISYGNIPSFAVTGNEIAKDGEYKSDEVTVENGDKFSYNLITTLNVADGKFKSVDFSHNGYYGEVSVRRSEMAYDYIKQFLVGKESSQSTIDEILLQELHLQLMLLKLHLRMQSQKLKQDLQTTHIQMMTQFTTKTVN